VADYTVTGSPITTATTVNLYWAKGPGTSLDDRILPTSEGGQAKYTPASVPFDGSIGSDDGVNGDPPPAIFTPDQLKEMGSPPAGATMLMAVADPQLQATANSPAPGTPNGLINDPTEADNFKSLPYKLPPVTLAQIEQIVPPPVQAVKKPDPSLLNAKAPWPARYRHALKVYNRAVAAYAKASAEYPQLAQTLVDFLNSDEAQQTDGINTLRRQAAFIGQVAVESQALTSIIENPSKFASSKSQYKGRGFIQVTGRENYTAGAVALNADLVNHPELAAQPAMGARFSGWWWAQRSAGGATLNELADNWNIGAITTAVNSAGKKSDDRLSYSDKALQALELI
jgi:predicted chitinase